MRGKRGVGKREIVLLWKRIERKNEKSPTQRLHKK